MDEKQMKSGYLIIDIGTGNLRVAVCDQDENILAIRRTDIIYHTDEAYPNAYYFRPDDLWIDVMQLIKEVTEEVRRKYSDLKWLAVTSTSQREGVVLLNQEGEGVIGLPNHDHRGREWEASIFQKIWYMKRQEGRLVPFFRL